MSDAQFYLMIGIPTFAVLIGILTNAVLFKRIHARFDRVDAGFDRLEAKLDAMIRKQQRSTAAYAPRTKLGPA
jgi:hypothetical protein